MTNNARILYYGIGYDLYLLDIVFKNNYDLGMSIKISIIKTNIWKDFYKTVFTRE